MKHTFCANYVQDLWTVNRYSMNVGMYLNWFVAWIRHAMPLTMIPAWCPYASIRSDYSLLNMIVCMQEKLLTTQVWTSSKLLWLQRQQILGQIKGTPKIFNDKLGKIIEEIRQNTTELFQVSYIIGCSRTCHQDLDRQTGHLASSGFQWQLGFLLFCLLSPKITLHRNEVDYSSQDPQQVIIGSSYKKYRSNLFGSCVCRISMWRFISPCRTSSVLRLTLWLEILFNIE